MSDLKKQLIKLGSTNPELRPHIREVLKASGGDESFDTLNKTASSMDMIDYILPERDFWKVVDNAPDHLQNFMMDIREELNHKLTLKGSEERALNRLINLIGNPPRDASDMANQVAKIGIELGLKPNFRF